MLSDIDRPLLNEMGITAIGDCLSILKHAKVIIAKLDEEKKDMVSRDTPKKRGEVAKRIIENYLGDIDPKLEKPTSNLSQDLISRLNFTKLPVVKFNEESLGKVVVSSTTDDLDYGEKSIKLKRRLNDNDEIADDEKPLEYRGLLKNANSSSSKPISLNDALKKKKTESKIINLNQDNKGTNALAINQTKKIISLKQIKQPEVPEKESVFSRIKPLAKSSSSAAAVRLLKEAVHIKNYDKKLTSVPSESNGQSLAQATKIVKLNQSKRLTKSIHERLSFN